MSLTAMTSEVQHLTNFLFEDRGHEVLPGYEVGPGRLETRLKKKASEVEGRSLRGNNQKRVYLTYFARKKQKKRRVVGRGWLGVPDDHFFLFSYFLIFFFFFFFLFSLS